MGRDRGVDARFTIGGLAPLLVFALAMLFFRPAHAVPAFAQQTGQPCSACHVGAFGPQLKPYARDFKLYGYQATDGKNHLPTFAVTSITSFTHTKDDQLPSAAPHFGANDNVAEDQASLYFGGRLPLGFGAFIQGTYDGVARAFSLDNTDIRHASVLSVHGKDLIVGVDFNNSPGIQDVWNSTPVWRFPYNSSPLGAYPTATALIDGPLAGQVASAGAYVFWDDTIYAEFSEYAPLNRVFAGRLGEGTNSNSDRFEAIPYWRLALNHDFGSNAALEVGTYGLDAHRYPGGVVQGGTDHITDWAVDLNYFNQVLKDNVVSLHATWIHEDDDLRASSLINGTNVRDHLNTARADLSWSYKDTITPTVQYFRTSGTPDPVLYGYEGGNPNSSGYVFELAYTGLGKPNSTPWWFNYRVAVQYTAYNTFNGTGAGASGANSVYVNLWLALAPLGPLVKR